MRYILCIFFFCLFSYCADSGRQGAAHRENGYTPILKNREDSVLHDVLKGHDEAMAKMSKLSKYMSRVQTRIDSMDKRGASRQKDPAYQQWIDLKDSLVNAEWGMNQWMEEFKLDSFQNNKDSRLRYLEAEKAKVHRVRERILSSLALADSLWMKR